jgi:hypothetical protein
LLIVLMLFFASMVTETERGQKAPFDALGALLTFVGFALLVLGATLAGELGWWSARRPFFIGDEAFAPFGLSAAVVFMLGGVVVLLIYGAWAEWRARQDLTPLFRVRIFRNRNFSVGAALGFCFQLAVGGLLFVLPVFLKSPCLSMPWTRAWCSCHTRSGSSCLPSAHHVCRRVSLR